MSIKGERFNVSEMINVGTKAMIERFQDGLDWCVFVQKTKLNGHESCASSGTNSCLVAFHSRSFNLQFLKINAQKIPQYFTLLIYSSICSLFILFYISITTTEKHKHTENNENPAGFRKTNKKRYWQWPWSIDPSLLSFQVLKFTTFIIFLYNELKWEPMEMLETIVTEKPRPALGKRLGQPFLLSPILFFFSFSLFPLTTIGFVYLWVNVRLLVCSCVHLYAHSVIHNVILPYLECSGHLCTMHYFNDEKSGNSFEYHNKN